MNHLRRSDESASRTACAGKWLATVAAVLGFAFLAGQAEASCGNDQRVSVSNSQCLWASHTSGSYEANNSCLHQITIKIDIARGRDATKTIAAATLAYCEPSGQCWFGNHGGQNPDLVLTPSGERAPNSVVAEEVTGTISTSWGRSIRAITCCSDLSASCNRRSTDSYP